MEISIHVSSVEEAYFFLSPLQGATNPEYNSISFTWEYIHPFHLSRCNKLIFKFSMCPIHTLFLVFFLLGKNFKKRTFCVKCEIQIRICIFQRKKLHILKDFKKIDTSLGKESTFEIKCTGRIIF